MKRSKGKQTPGKHWVAQVALFAAIALTAGLVAYYVVMALAPTPTPEPTGRAGAIQQAIDAVDPYGGDAVDEALSVDKLVID